MKVARALVALAVLLFVLFPAAARAQGTDVTGALDAAEIELGDAVTYTLRASGPGGTGFADPKLSVPGGLTLVDSGQSPSQTVSIVNGRVTEKQGLNVSWVLRSDRLGSFSIGPATILVGGVKKSSPRSPRHGRGARRGAEEAALAWRGPVRSLRDRLRSVPAPLSRCR